MFVGLCFNSCFAFLCALRPLTLLSPNYLTIHFPFRPTLASSLLSFASPSSHPLPPLTSPKNIRKVYKPPPLSFALPAYATMTVLSPA